MLGSMPHLYITGEINSRPKAKMVNKTLTTMGTASLQITNLIRRRPLSLAATLLAKKSSRTHIRFPIRRHRIVTSRLLRSQTSYLPRNVSELASLWAGDDFKGSLSILLSTTPSACECLNMHTRTRAFATLLSMVSISLPDTGFCAFNYWCWMLIVRPS